MPLLGWGCSGAKGAEATEAVQIAIKAGFRVGHQQLDVALHQCNLV